MSKITSIEVLCKVEQVKIDSLRQHMTPEQKRQADTLLFSKLQELSTSYTRMIAEGMASTSMRGESKTNNKKKGGKAQNTEKKKRVKSEISSIDNTIQKMCRNTTPIEDIPSLNATLADWNSCFAKRKRQLKICKLVEKHEKKMSKAGIDRQYDVGQLSRTIANGGKYNVKDWTEYLKKDLPKRRPNHSNGYAVQNILRSVE
tara:strand:+ start:39973 stop:40578 length:606 start_codon:yes stop_codon:yes gene_type:complete